MSATSGDEIDGTGLESTGVGTGIDAGQVGGSGDGSPWTDDGGMSPGTGGSGRGAGRGGDMDLQLDDLQEIVEDLGGRPVSDEEQARIDQAREAAAARREQAEQAAAEQATKEAEMAEAHANGEPYLWETTTRDGEDVEVWILEDGSTVYFDRDTETVVEMEWPPGDGPVYQGNMLYNGEAVSVYELPDGTTVLVDGDGTTVGYGDEIVSDTFYDPAWGEVYAVPQGPPSYDTILYDAETDEPLVKVNTGKETAVIEDAGTADVAVYSRYYPPGADYYLLIDEDGTIVDQIEIPPEEIVDVMGVLTVYDDGEVVVDLGVGELHVDVVGEEGGISFEVDAGAEELFGGSDWLGSIEAGVEWDEDGVELWAEADMIGDIASVAAGLEVGKDGFEVWVEAEGDLEGIGFDVEGRMGLTEDGQFFVGGDIGFDMNIGLLDIEGNVNGYVEVGPDGFEMTGGWDGKVGTFGAYVEGGQQGSLAFDKDGVTTTYEEYRGAGIAGLGSVRIGTELQFHTDGTKDGTSLTGGGYLSTNDADGDETGMIGLYTDLDSEGMSSPWVSDEHLDTGVTQERYDRHHGDDDTSGIPTDPDGSADYDAEFPDDADDADDADGQAGARDVFDVVAAERDRSFEKIEVTWVNRPDQGESPPAPPPPPPSEEGEEQPERPKIDTKRDPDAPDPEPKTTPKIPENKPPLFPRDDDPPTDDPDVPTEPSGPSGPAERPPIFTERVMDDENGDGTFGPDGRTGPGAGRDAGGGLGDGPPVMHAENAQPTAAPPPTNDTGTGTGIADDITSLATDQVVGSEPGAPASVSASQRNEAIADPEPAEMALSSSVPVAEPVAEAPSVDQVIIQPDPIAVAVPEPEAVPEPAPEPEPVPEPVPEPDPTGDELLDG